MLDFSIVIPVYNLEDCIIRTIESIKKNNIQNTEVILIDDGSTDETVKVIKDYLETHDEGIVKLVEKENEGVSITRNLGISLSKGEYIIFCDGDDYVDENLIDILKQNIRSNYDVICWRYCILQSNKSWASQDKYDKECYTNHEALESFLLGESKIRIGSFAVKRKLLIEKSIEFTPTCSIAEDIEFIYKVLAEAGTVGLVDEILYTYIKREGSAVNRFNINRFQAPEATRRAYYYIKKNTNLCDKSNIDNYMRNELYVIHSLYTFDSCVKYMNSFKDICELWRLYSSRYWSIELELRHIFKNANINIKNISRKRLLIFKLSRRVYLYMYALKYMLNSNNGVRLNN